MWTQDNRSRYDRSHPRYPSDLADEEWAEIAPEIPLAGAAGTMFSESGDRHPAASPTPGLAHNLRISRSKGPRSGHGAPQPADYAKSGLVGAIPDLTRHPASTPAPAA